MMQSKIASYLENKSIAILGFGIEGKSTYRYIRKYLPNKKLTIIDRKDQTIDDPYVKVISGEDYLTHLEGFDLIIKSPGITLKDINKDNIIDTISSQLELLLMFYKEQVIGITGTKGKSTTTSLIYNVLKASHENTFLVGNIGIPILDEVDKFDKDSIIVNEMSSDQLEYVHYSPHVGIIVNMYEDHLDHAGSVEHYHESKLNMFKYQNEEDIAIYCSDNHYLKEYMKNALYKAKKYPVQLEYDENSISLKENEAVYNREVIYKEDGKRQLKGLHNLENIMIAALIGTLYNVDKQLIKEAVDNFAGLEHRLELVGKYNGVYYYNDSIATIPAATISGINALGNVNTLIFGGLDRGIHYEPLIEFLKDASVENLICMPSTGTKVGKALENTGKHIYYVDTLEEAVKVAKEVTKKETICLMSPAAASYEYFKNFEEKGKKYKEYVRGE